MGLVNYRTYVTNRIPQGIVDTVSGLFATACVESIQ